MDLIHGFLTSKDVLDCVVHRVVEKTSEVILVRANISRISVEAFTHLENPRTFSILLPEVLGYLWDCINPNSVKFEFRHDVLDPVFEVVSNIVI
jgi:hypothetical protein